MNPTCSSPNLHTKTPAGGTRPKLAKLGATVADFLEDNLTTIVRLGLAAGLVWSFTECVHPISRAFGHAAVEWTQLAISEPANAATISIFVTGCILAAGTFALVWALIRPLWAHRHHVHITEPMGRAVVMRTPAGMSAKASQELREISGGDQNFQAWVLAHTVGKSDEQVLKFAHEVSARWFAPNKPQEQYPVRHDAIRAVVAHEMGACVREVARRANRPDAHLWLGHPPWEPYTQTLWTHLVVQVCVNADELAHSNITDTSIQDMISAHDRALAILATGQLPASYVGAPTAQALIDAARHHAAGIITRRANDVALLTEELTKHEQLHARDIATILGAPKDNTSDDSFTQQAPALSTSGAM